MTDRMTNLTPTPAHPQANPAPHLTPHPAARRRAAPTLRGLLLGGALGLWSMAAAAGGPGPHWSYGHGGHGSPPHWGELDPAFEACAKGQRQSPIDIRGAVAADLPALQFQYDTAASPAWVNNGHTVQLNFQPGSRLAVGERSFELLQFHLHTPSEEAINGKRADLVAHFVHRDAQGKLGVVAALFKRGPANPAWGGVLAHLPRPGETLTVADFKLDVASLLPAERGYYSFEGSLTTPPCSEGVSWMVLKQVQTLSGEQLRAFRRLYAGNARPLQAVNGREIRESRP